MERAFQSLLNQSPDEIRIYLDPVRLGNKLDHVKTFLEEQGAKTFIQEVTPHIRDHHDDVVNAVHRAILEAEHKFVAWNDDDDEILGNRREFLDEFAADDVGVIYGDVLAKRNNHFNVRRTIQIHEPRNVHHIIGSGQIYNRDAFRKIHHLVDHGYWWDFKIFYWMVKAGYKAVYVPKLFSLQNVNTTPSQKRSNLRGKWFDTANRLDKQQLKLRRNS